MFTVTTRELKQNPAAAIRRVLETTEPTIITAHGQPTGVMIVPQTSGQRTWVSGQALLSRMSSGNDEQVRAWRDDLSVSRAEGFGREIFE